MHDSNTIFVGLDVHKNSIDIALAESGRFRRGAPLGFCRR